VVPFPASFREVLAHHIKSMEAKRAGYLFESSWKRKYSERGVREIVARYGRAAGLAQPISPHQLRHFLLTWLKKQGIDDALIQPYSGHAHRQSLEVYSRLAIEEAQKEYDHVIGRFRSSQQARGARAGGPNAAARSGACVDLNIGNRSTLPLVTRLLILSHYGLQRLNVD